MPITADLWTAMPRQSRQRLIELQRHGYKGPAYLRGHPACDYLDHYGYRELNKN